MYEHSLLAPSARLRRREAEAAARGGRNRGVQLDRVHGQARRAPDQEARERARAHAEARRARALRQVRGR